MGRPEKVRLGDLLVNANLISQQQLDQALMQQQSSGRRLGRLLVENGFVNEEQISETLAKLFNIPYINLKRFNLNPELLKRIPEEQARRYRAIVLDAVEDRLRVGMADPTDAAGFEEIKRILKCEVDLVVVTEGQVLESIDRGYRHTNEIGGQMYTRVNSGLQAGHVVASGEAAAPEVSVTKQIQALFNTAMQVRASDIHIELTKEAVVCRLRIDGMLHAHIDLGYPPTEAVVLRLKLMAELDIAEKYLPQSGSFRTHVDDQGLLVNLVSCPVKKGESIVMHLTYQNRQRATLDSLGMPENMLIRLREIIEYGKGMVLFVAPPDAGITTTMYAVLTEVDKVSKKIFSVEDLVEHQITGVNQIQVDRDAGFDYLSALQAAAVQDPDVLMLSSIHDKQVARLTIKTAMEQRVVLASLSSNDAATALFHFSELGVPAFMVASSVQVVIAQRLLRRICPHCSEPYVANSQESAWLKSEMISSGQIVAGLRRGHGCGKCQSSGYLGRIAVFEMLEMKATLVEAAAHDAPGPFLKEAAQQMHGHKMLDQALDLLKRGQTTVNEVMHMSIRH